MDRASAACAREKRRPTPQAEAQRAKDFMKKKSEASVKEAANRCCLRRSVRHRKAITEFLKTKRPKKELATALEVLREFKKCESAEEWYMTMFVAWAKLEQLEEFLAHIVE